MLEAQSQISCKMRRRILNFSPLVPFVKSSNRNEWICEVHPIYDVEKKVHWDLQVTRHQCRDTPRHYQTFSAPRERKNLIRDAKREEILHMDAIEHNICRGGPNSSSQKMPVCSERASGVACTKVRGRDKGKLDLCRNAVLCTAYVHTSTTSLCSLPSPSSLAVTASWLLIVWLAQFDRLKLGLKCTPWPNLNYPYKIIKGAASLWTCGCCCPMRCAGAQRNLTLRLPSRWRRQVKVELGETFICLFVRGGG